MNFVFRGSAYGDIVKGASTPPVDAGCRNQQTSLALVQSPRNHLDHGLYEKAQFLSYSGIIDAVPFFNKSF